MTTIGDLRTHCKAKGIKFTATYGNTKKITITITITKTRAVKIVLTWGKISWSFWDDHRKSYVVDDKRNTSYYRLEDSVEINDWYGSIIDLLDTKPAEKTKAKEFPVPKQEFDGYYILSYTNGLAKADITITQACVSGVVKITSRGLIKEMETEDNCDCWFLVDGRGKCASDCKGRPARIIYDGERYYTTIEKTDKSYRIATKQLKLTTLDKMVVDTALKLFLTFKEKDQSG